MAADRIKELKDKGNVHFKEGQWTKALEFYTKATELAKTENVDGLYSREIAILLSNSAQTCFQLKEYKKMLDAAEESLHYDPAFKKSKLRRAIANLELGHLDDAEREMRELLKGEPKNQILIQAIRRIIPSAKMSTALLKAHTEQYLRRATIHAKGSGEDMQSEWLEKKLNYFLLRISFSSQRSSTTMKFLKDWRKHEWPAKSLIFYVSVPNLSTFERFSGIIRDTLAEVSLPITLETTPFGCSDVVINQFKKNLYTLKKCFPYLTTVTGKFITRITKDAFRDGYLKNTFVKDLNLVVKQFNSTIRPKWCKKFQIYLLIALEIEIDDDRRLISSRMEKMTQFFREAQSKMKGNAKKSSLKVAPIVSRFDDLDNFSCFALLEIETEHADFEFMFQIASMPNLI